MSLEERCRYLVLKNKKISWEEHYYVLDQTGRIQSVIENGSDQVSLLAGTWDGAPSIVLPLGSSVNISSGRIDIDGYGQQNLSFFEFLANNTHVEWSMSVNSNSYEFHIATTHNRYGVDSYIYKGCDTQYHSHESINSDYPSDLDRDAQRQFSNNGYNSFYIFYEPTNSYIPY